MNLGVFITCRNGSTRLPGKCNLHFIKKISYIEFIFQRTFKIQTKCKKILCTTNKKVDSELVKKAKKFKISYFRGDTKDKLKRWKNTAKKFKIDFFVTVDGDDPLFDPHLIDKAFEQYLVTRADFIEAKGLICGLFTYGISTAALNKVCKIKNTSDTEMMSVYFTDTGIFNCEQLKNIDKKFYRDDIRLTLDYPEDHIFFKTLVKNIINKKKFLGTKEILNIINKKPELLKINKHRIKEWKYNQLKKTKLLIKK
jgi:spore coat polysaccharide biosynthesis protein SpsF (cytidylyltransferase family)